MTAKIKELNCIYTFKAKFKYDSKVKSIQINTSIGLLKSG